MITNHFFPIANRNIKVSFSLKKLNLSLKVYNSKSILSNSIPKVQMEFYAREVHSGNKEIENVLTKKIENEIYKSNQQLSMIFQNFRLT